MVKCYKKKGKCVKFSIILIFFSVLAFAKEYYAKVEPLTIDTISSNVNGEILLVKKDLIGKKLLNQPYIIIDSRLDKIDLNSTTKKISILKDMIKFDKEIIKNLEESLERKKINYENIKDLSIKSKVEKDNMFFDLINTKNQLINTKKELQNYISQLADLNYKKAKLQKSIKDKTIISQGYVLYDILVKKGQVVNIGTPLSKVANTKKAILTIYVDKEDLKNIKAKDVYIDGRKTSYKVNRVNYIADSVNLSKYKVQIIINPPKIFSNLVKVELK